MGRLEFGPSVVPELREILLSVSEARTYSPDGRVDAAMELPFLEEWHLDRLCFDPSLGRSRIVCALTRAGREVTAVIDAADFPDVRSNTTKNRELNEPYSAYHDLAVILSTLIHQQIVSRDPDRLDPEIRILPAARDTGVSPRRRRGGGPKRRVEFGPSVVPELREILLSVSEARTYGPDGRMTEVREVPFLEDWRLSRLCFDPVFGRSRIVCVLARAGRELTAVIDAADFPDVRSNTTKSLVSRGTPYHDLAVALSTLIDEQIVSRDPDDLPDEIQILRPADRLQRRYLSVRVKASQACPGRARTAPGLLLEGYSKLPDSGQQPLALCGFE